jgi:membrane protease YdiL (CAAX protease family)
MSSLRQLRAVVWLVWQHWRRGPLQLRGGGGGGASESRRAGALLRVVIAAVMCNAAFSIGRRTADGLARAPGSLTWLLVAFGTLSFAVALAQELPSPRQPAAPLKSSFLEQLPLTPLSNLLIALSHLVFWLLFAVAGTLGAADLPHANGGLIALAGALWFFTAACTGMLVGKLLRLALSPLALSRMRWLVTALSLSSLLLVSGGNSFMPAVALPLVGPLAVVLRGGEGALPVLLQLVLACAAAAAAVLLTERRAYDRSEPIPVRAVRPTAGNQLTLRHVATVLLQREPGGRFGVIWLWLVLAGVSGFAGYLGRRSTVSPQMAVTMAKLFAAQSVLTFATMQASRAAARDVLARPLLGSLPIAPRETLAGKVSAIRRAVVPLTVPGVMVALALPEHAILEVLWQPFALAVAVILYADCVVSVAFLTVGLGTHRTAPGAFGSLESLLVGLPFVTVALTTDPLTALASLATLAAVMFEARRAAMRAVDWFYDAELDRETVIWRALLVFAAFQASQALVGQFAAFALRTLSEAARLALVYAVSGAVLVLMTLRTQGRERLVPWRVSATGWGLLAGTLSAAAALAYASVVQRLGLDGAAIPIGGMADQVLLVVTLVVAAPLVEERYFRGWLQPLLLAETRGRQALAIALGAFAFAIVHPALSFVPVLVLGLLTGALLLWKNSLAACAAAHAVHNGAALFAIALSGQ